MELLSTGILKGMEQEIGHVLISIVKGTAQADNVFVFLIVDKFICTFVKWLYYIIVIL